jgi:hypothetical protein
VLVVVLVLENPDRFAIRLTEQISGKTPVSWRSRNPMHRGRARRRGRGRLQISEFGFKERKHPGAGSKTARRFGFPPLPAHRLGLRARKIEELIHGPGCFT